MADADSLRDGVRWHQRCADVLDRGLTTFLGAGVFSDNGVHNIYDCTYSGRVNALKAGDRFRFIPDTTNTRDEAVCFRINGGVKVFLYRNLAYYLGGTYAAVQIGDIIPDTAYEVECFSSTAAVIVDDRRLIQPVGGYTQTLAAASGTYTSTSIAYTRYERIQPSHWTKYITSFTGTTSATPAYLTTLLPWAAANLGANQVFPCSVQDGTDTAGYAIVQNNSNVCRVYRADFANFGAGATRGAFLGFSYYAA